MSPNVQTRITDAACPLSTTVPQLGAQAFFRVEDGLVYRSRPSISSVSATRICNTVIRNQSSFTLLLQEFPISVTSPQFSICFSLYQEVECFDRKKKENPGCLLDMRSLRPYKSPTSRRLLLTITVDCLSFQA
jgi:hypothetical protein